MTAAPRILRWVIMPMSAQLEMGRAGDSIRTPPGVGGQLRVRGRAKDRPSLDSRLEACASRGRSNRSRVIGFDGVGCRSDRW
jgi:hypothetical protein